VQRKSDVITGKLLVVYYSATALFMLLDYVFEINVRLAFLDLYPGWRLAYYLFCFLCLGLILWRPAWAAFIGAAESILTVSLLIISAAMRVIIVTDEMIDTGRGAVSYNEMINFAIAFSVVYVSYTRSIKALQGR
jgi:hypothetical protein